MGSMPSMTNLHLGGILVGDVSTPAQDLERSARKAARQGVDHLVMQFYMKGGCRMTTDAGSSVAQGRAAIVYDLSQPLTVHSDQAAETVNVLVPRAFLAEEGLPLEQYHGAVLDYAADPIGQILFSCLREIIGCSDRLSPHHLPGLNVTAGRLFGTFLRGATLRKTDASMRKRIEIRKFIQDNIGLHELDAALVQQRFGLSRATLYRDFVEDGGVGNYIRECRLAAARRLLARPAAKGGRPRVSSVAYATGFSDEKTFSRAFKARYSLLPRDVRAGEVSLPAADGDRPDVLMCWIKDLTGEASAGAMGRA